MLDIAPPELDKRENIDDLIENMHSECWFLQKPARQGHKQITFTVIQLDQTERERAVKESIFYYNTINDPIVL